MSDNTQTYGQLQSEKLAEDSRVAHQIVKEIGHFGINDRQRWLIIYQLGLELENVDEMKELSGFIKELKGDTLFISRLYGGAEESTNG